MSEDGPASGPERRFGDAGARKRLNGHANGHAPEAGEGKGGPSVVVPFPKKVAPRRSWLPPGLLGQPGSRFGTVFGWVAVIAFAALFWGIKKDGVVDIVDVFAGLVGVLTALWFHRSR